MPRWSERLQGIDERVLGRERMERPTPRWVVPVIGFVFLILAAFFAVSGRPGPVIISLGALAGLVVGVVFSKRSGWSKDQ